METCETEFMVWLAKYGRSSCERVMKNWNRKRLDVVGRTERKRYPWSEYKRLYDMQRGICSICRNEMVLIRGKVDMDHRDPNLTGAEFEARSNRSITHSHCNRSKGGKSIMAQAKQYSRTAADILAGVVDHNEPMED
jgi:hypothetical protein